MARRLRILIGLAALAAALLVSAANGAATPEDLSGDWLNAADTASHYGVLTPRDGSRITVLWRGRATHAGLNGRLTGRRAGDFYRGTFRITEGGTTVDGLADIAIVSRKNGGYPLLKVTLEPNGGGVTKITLELNVATPSIAPRGEAVDEPVNCDSKRGCSGDVADIASTPGAIDPGSARYGPYATPSGRVTVGDVAFKLKPGQGTTVVVPLNRNGRALLAQRGVLKVTIIVTMRTGLPGRTIAGTVTFQKRR